MEKILLKVLIILNLLIIITGLSASERELFREAETRYLAENYILALDVYDEFLNTYPLSDLIPDVQYRRAVCLYNLKQYNESLELFFRIETRYRSTRYLNYIHYWAGLCLYHLKDFARSVDSFSSFLTVSGNRDYTINSLIYMTLGEVFLNDYSEASKTITILLEYHSDSEQYPYGVVLLSYIYLKQEAYAETIELLETNPLENYTENLRNKCYLYKAEALWQLNKLDAAHNIYLSLIDSGTDDMALIAYRRNFLYAQINEDFNSMEDILAEAEQRFSDNEAELIDLWIQVGIESYKRGKYELCSYFLNKAWEKREELSISSSVPIYLSEVQIRNQQTADARKILEEALISMEDSSGAIIMRLGDTYFMENSFENAINFYEQFLENNFDSSRYYEATYFLAFSYYKSGNLNKALEIIAQVLEEYSSVSRLELDDYYKQFLILQWQIYKSLYNYAEAEEALQKYIHTFPLDIHARLELLKLFFIQNDYDSILSESATFNEEYSGLQYTDPYAFLLVSYLRGLSLISDKSYGEALTALSPITKESVESAGLNVILPYAHYYRAWSLYRLELIPEAISAFTNFKKEYPEHEMTPMSIYLIGWCYYTQGEYLKALTEFTELAEQSIESEKIDTSGLTNKSIFLAAKCYMNTGRFEEARTLLYQIYNSTSSFADDALYDYAMILSEEGNTSSAINTLNEFVNTYTDSSLLESVYYKIGELHFMNSSYEDAVNAFFTYRMKYEGGQFTDASLYWSGLASSSLNEKLNTLLVWEMLIIDHKQSPYYIDTVQRTAEIYISYNDFAKALEIYTELINLYPEEAEAYNIEQEVSELRYLILGLSDKEAELTALVERNNNAATKTGREAMIELSRLYLNDSDNLYLAYNLLEDVIAVTEDRETHANAQYLIGEYYFKENNFISAGNEFLKAAVINPSDRDLIASSLFRAAEMMKLAGMNNDVRAMVLRLEQNFPNSQLTIEARKLLPELE